MKTQISKLMAAILLMVCGMTAQANGNEREISLKTENSKTVVLEMKHIKSGTDISIWNEEGKLLYQDEVRGNSYARLFNLDQLEKGELTLEIENEESLEVMQINVSEEAAVLKKSDQQVYSKPVVKLAGDQLKVYFGEGHKCAEMKITDQFSDTVFEGNISKDEKGLKRYDVSKLSEGKYNIQFTADGRSFYHTIIIK